MALHRVARPTAPSAAPDNQLSLAGLRKSHAWALPAHAGERQSTRVTLKTPKVFGVADRHILRPQTLFTA
jgi:hypothetical protein